MIDTNKTRKERLYRYLSKGKNTLEIQLNALVSFLEELGYKTNVESNIFHSSIPFHIWKENEDGSKTYLKLDTAVALYNRVTVRIAGHITDVLGIKGNIKFDTEVWHQAHKNKLLDKVHLQRCDGGLKVSSNWISVNLSQEDKEDLV